MTTLVRSCKTFHSLHSELQAQDFDISLSGTYVQLLPRNSRTSECKRHVSTVPVNLFRAQTELRQAHVDGKFCTELIRESFYILIVLCI